MILSVVLLSIIVLSVVLVCVILLNVAAPLKKLDQSHIEPHTSSSY